MKLNGPTRSATVRLSVWDRDEEALRSAADVIAMGRLSPTDFEVEVVSIRGDARPCRSLPGH
jgi:hypothetical protein